MSSTDVRLSRHDADFCKRAGEILLVCASADDVLSKMQGSCDGRPEEERHIRACLRSCGFGTDIVSPVRCWRAYLLLQGASRVGHELSEEPWFPIQHYQRAWSLLVKSSGEGEWSLLPGMEEDCRAAYRSAAEHGIDAAACRIGCRELFRSWAIRHRPKTAR
jgi:hypothetical protein